MGKNQHVVPHKGGWAVRGEGNSRVKLRRRLRELERENVKLKRQLHQAETVIEVQEKLSEILGIPLDSDDDDSS